MIFMIPIPPTNNDIPAMQASKIVIMSVVELNMNLADFFGCLRGKFFRQCRTVDTLQVGNGENAFLYRSIRCEYHIVLVHTHAVVSFGRESTYDFKGNFIEPDYFSNRAFSIGEEIVGNGFPD